MTFIESGASSACELVTELLQFQGAPERLSKIQASILMAGIMLDTKNFSTRVTSRTFDVASYLRSLEVIVEKSKRSLLLILKSIDVSMS